MGLPMAGHLMDAGYEMHIYARHPEKVTSLVEKGLHFILQFMIV